MNNIPDIYLAYIAILLGFAALVWSADRFVAGAASIAKNMGITPMIIGLTIVSFGTSAPEVLVSLNASINGAGDLAVGNAIGSNIANVALVLAVTTLICRIPVSRHLLLDELPVLLIISVMAGVFLMDSNIGRAEGWILLLSIVPIMFYIIYRKKSEVSHDDISEEEIISSEDIPQLSQAMAFFWFAVGLIALIVSSRVLVWGGETTASHFGVSPLIIGLTVIAVGTSLPDLAASLMSAIKGHHDIALGNIIGSNMFNLAAVMSLPGIISPVVMDSQVFTRDYAFMMAFMVLLAAAVIIAITKQNSSSKRESQKAVDVQSASIGWPLGVILLSGYIAYYVILFVGL